MSKRLIQSLLLVAITAFSTSNAFVFELDAKTFRCFTEEIGAGVFTTMHYAAAPGYAQFIDVKVTDPQNTILHTETATDKGLYEFTADHGGEYAFCFYSRMVPGVSYVDGMKRRLSVVLRIGTDNTDYEQLATSEHMKPMEVNLRVMEDTVRMVHSEYEYYKEREIQMRDTNEHMNAKVMWGTLFVMALVCAFGWWQVRHMKGFFRKKRMID